MSRKKYLYKPFFFVCVGGGQGKVLSIQVLTAIRPACKRVLVRNLVKKKTQNGVVFLMFSVESHIMLPASGKPVSV